MMTDTLLLLANHLWQSTLCVGVAWLLTLALRRNRAAVRHVVWMAASVKFLLPFSLLVTAGSQLGFRSAPAIGQAQIGEVITDISQPFAVSAEAPERAARPRPLSYLPMIVAGVWLCGIVVTLAHWARLLRRMRAIIRAATPLHLNLPIPTMSSAARLEPGVFGIWRPVLLLPEGIGERLKPAHFEAVIAHELSHVQRRDNLTAAVHLLVEVIFWFYPLVWWMRTRLVEERERACDEEVLHMGAEPEAYAESILAVCKLYLRSRLPCMSGVGGANLRGRIERIISPSAVRPLDLRRKILLASAAVTALLYPIAIGVMHPVPARAQAQAGVASAFEVASIKPAQPPTVGRPILWGIRSDPEQVTYSNQTLLGLIASAYEVDADRISGGPGWIRSDIYDIVAKLPPGTSKASIPMLLKALLVERFGLVVRQETKEASVYAMVPGKGGPKLKPSQDTSGPDGSTAPTAISSVPIKLLAGGAKVGICCGRAELHHVTMARFAELLTAQTDRPVIDRTGISGAFEISLHWAADDSPERSDSASEPSIYTAVQEQLGIKLEPLRGPLDYLLVQHVDKPSQN
jgi:bla regulator protein blaR1